MTDCFCSSQGLPSTSAGCTHSHTFYGLLSPQSLHGGAHLVQRAHFLRR